MYRPQGTCILRAAVARTCIYTVGWPPGSMGRGKYIVSQNGNANLTSSHAARGPFLSSATLCILHTAAASSTSSYSVFFFTPVTCNYCIFADIPPVVQKLYTVYSIHAYTWAYDKLYVYIYICIRLSTYIRSIL